MEPLSIHTVIRSRRKTIALIISPDATLTVRAPLRVSLTYIEQLVHKKQRWIRRKIKEIAARPKISPHEFLDGEAFFYLGKTYPLKIVENDTLSIGDYFYFPRSMISDPLMNFNAWYKKQAMQIIPERVAWYARQIGVEYRSIRISNARRQWGCCSHARDLKFSWRLVMAPMHVIDYVVVHELSHVQELNHGPRFWQKVKLCYPGYEQAKQWLKGNAQQLSSL